MNQHEKIILDTGFNRNSKIGVVLAHLYKPDTPVGTVVIRSTIALHFNSVKFLIVANGEKRRKYHCYVKLILAVPRMNYSIMNLNRIIKRNYYTSYGNTEVHPGDVYERQELSHNNKNTMNFLVQKASSVSVAGDLSNAVYNTYPLIVDKIIKNEILQKAIRHNVWFSENNYFRNNSLVLNSILKSTRSVEYLKLFSNAESYVTVNRYKNMEGHSNNKTGILRSKDYHIADLVETIAGNKLVIKNVNNRYGINNNNNNTYEPKSYLSIYHGRENLSYTWNLNIRSNSNQMILRELHGNFRPIKQRILSPTTTISGKLIRSDSVDNTFRINSLQKVQSQLILIHYQQNGYLKKQAGLSMMSQNRVLIPLSGIADKFTKRVYEPKSVHINEAQHLLNNHTTIMQKRETINLTKNSSLTDKFLNLQKNNELKVTTAHGNSLLTKQNELQHVTLKEQTIQKSNDNDSESNKTVTAKNKIVLQKPQGIADLPEEFLAKNQIGVLADRIIGILEDKYQNEAKRKGLI